MLDQLESDNWKVIIESLRDRKWRRPYPISWWHVGVGTISAIGIALFIGVAAKGFSTVSTRPGRTVEILLIDVAFFGLFFAFAWRLFTMGINVGRVGVRYRGPTRTRIIPWSDVKGVRLAPLKFKSAINSRSEALTVWIDRHHGDPIQTHVNNQGVDFLGRRRTFSAAFAEIAASVEVFLSQQGP